MLKVVFIILTFTNVLLAQHVDTALLNKIIYTMTTHPKMVSTTLAVSKGDLIRGSIKGPAFFGESTFEDSNSTRPLILLIRPYGWLKALQQLGSDERGWLNARDFDFYAIPYVVHYFIKPPLLIDVDSAFFKNPRQYILQLNTHFFHTFNIWKNYYPIPLKNPPKFYYKFRLIFEKKQGEWVLTKLKRKRNGRFGIPHKRHKKYAY